MKVFFSIIFIITFTFFLPYLFDKTSKPVESEFIYCLGGGNDYSRINRAKEIFDKNYSSKNLLIYTGSDYTSRNIYPSKSSFKIETYKNLKNTFEEISFLKEYMLKNNFKNVIIITDKYHSLRVDLFAKYILNFESLNLEYTIVSPINRSFFYTYKKTFLELFKIIFNSIKYTIFL